MFAGDPDQLPAMAAGLRRHARWAREFEAGYNARSTVVSRRVTAAVAHLQKEVRLAEAALRAAPPEDNHAERAALAEARHKLALGLACQREADDVLAETATHVRASATRSSVTAEQGNAALRRLWQDLDRALQAFDAAVNRLLGTSVASAAPVPGAAIGPFGHTLVTISDIDDSDSAVRGPQDFGDTTLHDMRIGLARLEEVIIPAVRNGAGVERMRELDQRSGLTGDPASYVRVYDAFFGTSCVKLCRERDGRLTVIGGYHRIHAARQAGVDTLPAQIKETR